MALLTQKITDFITSKYFFVLTIVIAYQHSIHAAIIVTFALILFMALNQHYIEPFNSIVTNEVVQNDPYEVVQNDPYEVAHDDVDHDDIMTSTMEQSIVDKMWFPESNDSHYDHSHGTTW